MRSFPFLLPALVVAACVTSTPVPDLPGPGHPDEGAAPKPDDPPPSSGRSRFDLPGECSSKLGVAHGIDDLSECEGLLNETQSLPVSITAMVADRDTVEARIAVTGVPESLADGIIHATFTDGRPMPDGDLTFGRFSGEFAQGPQVFGFVLRERSASESAWVFHITGGSGCLSNAHGELSVLERSKGTLRLEKGVAGACTAAPAIDPPKGATDGGR